MDASFIPVEVVPSKTPFGLDQLRRSYKTALSAEDAIAAAPDVGDADEVFGNMFLMPISTPESAESATRIELVYMGTFGETLPAQKHDTENAVQSASSSKSSTGLTSLVPITVQFYAPTNVLTYFSAGAPGTLTAADPTDALTVISIAVGDTSLTAGSIPGLVGEFFQIQILETHSATEIVPGQYWQNTSRKIKSYIGLITDLAPGAYVTLGGSGSGYTVGNSLGISAGGQSASMTVTAVGISGSVASFTTTGNSFTTAQNLLPASGGSGSLARFNVIIIP